MKKGFFFFMILMFTIVNFSLAEEWDYCKDKEIWEEWEELVAKFPDNQDVHILHALRIGLCTKVHRGELTGETAMQIFERAREVIIRQMKEHQGRQSGLMWRL